jgi:glycosyltransferase involved in cell wall biosynthesis
MRILYDSQIFRIQNFGGVSRYCAELMYGLEQHKEYEVLSKKFFSYNNHLRLLGLTNYNFIRDSINIPGKKYVERFVKRKEDKFLFKTLKNGTFDIFHPTYYNPPFLKYLAKDKALVLTIHDMTYELYYDKQYNKIHQESINKRNIIKRAKHIIAVSENTKKDVLSLYPEINSDSITVIYHGSSLLQDIPESNIKLPPKFLLFVGKRGKYKNFLWLLNSIADFINRNNINLICAGGRPFSNEERDLINDLNVKQKVTHFEIQNDQDLATLYKRTACFIYPSSHEGFGIPILEAYSCGCPTLLAESSCFPEIGANGALYFENGNKDQLIDQLNRILNDKELVIKLKNNGFERVKDFSWQNSVQQHIDVYKRVMSA